MALTNKRPSFPNRNGPRRTVPRDAAENAEGVYADDGSAAAQSIK